MTIRFQFVFETPDARLYRRADGSELWIPRSVCKSTVKLPAENGLTPAIHIVELEEWFAEKKGLI